MCVGVGTRGWGVHIGFIGACAMLLNYAIRNDGSEHVPSFVQIGPTLSKLAQIPGRSCSNLVKLSNPDQLRDNFDQI